jgi:hypothetical protein
VVENQGQVLVFEGAKLEKEIIVFMNSEFLPKVGVNAMQKGSPGVMGDFLQDREQRMCSREIHGLLL